jgi:hypothetical protein
MSEQVTDTGSDTTTASGTLSPKKGGRYDVVLGSREYIASRQRGSLEGAVCELLGASDEPSPAYLQALDTAHTADNTLRHLRERAGQLKRRVDDLLIRLDENAWRARVSDDGEAHWDSVHLDQLCAQFGVQVRVVAQILGKMGHELR